MRSLLIQMAPTTQPTAIAASLATQPAAATRPTVLMRSISTLPAAPTRPTGSGRYIVTTTPSYNTATGNGALVATLAAAATTPPVLMHFIPPPERVNIALGYYAGFNLTVGNNNIYIGNVGGDSESNTIRIGGDIGLMYRFSDVHLYRRHLRSR